MKYTMREYFESSNSTDFSTAYGRSGGSSIRDTVYLPEYEGYGWMDYDETLTGKKLGFYDDISDEEGETISTQSNVSTSLWKNIDTYRRATLAASTLPFVILTLLMLPPSTFPLAVTLVGLVVLYVGGKCMMSNYNCADDASIDCNEAKNEMINNKDGSWDAIDAALELTWSNPTISNPHGIGIAMGSKDEWMRWARPMATEPDRLDMYWKEYEKDVNLHKSTLDKLSKDMEEGYCNGMEYIKALNCILHDTFDRLSLDCPPCLNLQQGVQIMQQHGKKNAHMKIWKGYENRAFALLKAVQEHPLTPKPEPYEYFEECYPLENRGRFPSATRRREWEREEEEESGLYGGCYGLSGSEVGDLLSQGIKPWDDE